MLLCALMLYHYDLTVGLLDFTLQHRLTSQNHFSPNGISTFVCSACRHGDRCSRAHNKPLFSQTVCLKGMYVNPIGKIYGDSQRAVRRLTREEERDIQQGFEDFYIDVFDEVAKFGEMEDLFVCDNLGDHLIGEYQSYLR